MLLVLIALAVSITAAVLVYHSWNSRDKAPADGAGWLLAVISMFAWSRALGTEFGITYAILVFVCLVWIVIVFTLEPARSTNQSARRPFQAMRWPQVQTCFRHSALFLLSVPAAGVTSMMLSVVLAFYLPWSMPTKVAVVIFSFPIVWGGFSAWICAQDKLLKPTLASLGLFAVSGLILIA